MSNTHPMLGNATDKQSEPSSAGLKDAGPILGQSSFTTETYKAPKKESALSNHHYSDKVASNSKKLPPMDAMTDPNSIYRKLYNRDMDFFLWVLEKQNKAPYVFKLHLQANSKNEMKVPTVKRSIKALISYSPPG